MTKLVNRIPPRGNPHRLAANLDEPRHLTVLGGNR